MVPLVAFWSLSTLAEWTPLYAPVPVRSRRRCSQLLHTKLDFDKREVVEAHSMAMLFRGYELILKGRDPRDVIDITPAASAAVCTPPCPRWLSRWRSVSRHLRWASWFAISERSPKCSMIPGGC